LTDERSAVVAINGDPDWTTAARREVTSRFGKAVADKATERFLAEFSPTVSTGFREMGIQANLVGGRFVDSGSTSPAVLCFEKPALSQDGAYRARDTSRQELIRIKREATYAQMQAAYLEVERLSERSWAGARSADIATQLCWLSASLRTSASPLVLSEVANDDRIVAVDIPERLERESGYGPSTIHAPAARQRLGLDGEGVVVAVLDGEVFGSHPDLAGRVFLQRNRTLENWGSPDLHGTAVAGLVAASGSNPGVAPGATIYNYKVFATVPALNSDRFDAERALQFALEDGAHIANCSWQAPPVVARQPNTLGGAVQDAWDLGMFIVKSAGNEGLITYPGLVDGLLVVGTTNLDGTVVPPESGRGNRRPHLVAPGGAPGEQVQAPLINGAHGPVGWGTSYAAPLAAGAAALLLQQQPNLRPPEIQQRMVDTAKVIPGADPSAAGAGLLDLGSW
jgi:serine protease AprX